MRRTFNIGALVVLAGGFLVTTADVTVLGFEGQSVGLLFLALGLGVGVAGEVTSLESGARLTAIGLAATTVVTVGVLAVSGGLIPALAIGVLLAVGVGYLTNRRVRNDG